jgi:Holliday junction resolvasome RuvABC endonuclease subunit
LEEWPMIKIFQGDYQTVQSDINTWIDVYNPNILQIEQSMVAMEHTIVILLTVLYEEREISSKVEYKMQKYKK